MILQSQGRATTGGRISDELIFAFMDNICQSFLATIETLSSVLDASEDILNFLACQAELLLQLTRTVCKSLSLHVSLLVLKCASSGLKLLSALKPLPSEANLIMKLLLTLLLSVLQSDSLNAHSGGATNESSGEDFSKVSNATLGLLPILCNFWALHAIPVSYGLDTEVLLDTQDLVTCPAESSPTANCYAETPW